MYNFKAIVLSAAFLASGTYSAMLKVVSVQGETLAEPIVVDFKTSAERGDELVTAGFGRSAKISFDAEGITEFQKDVDVVLTKEGHEPLKLHRTIGSIKNIVVEKWVRPLTLETRADQAAAKAKPMVFGKVKATTKPKGLAGVMDAIGLTKK